VHRRLLGGMCSFARGRIAAVERRVLEVACMQAFGVIKRGWLAGVSGESMGRGKASRCSGVVP
jgi:hypothetical protein